MLCLGTSRQSEGCALGCASRGHRWEAVSVRCCRAWALLTSLGRSRQAGQGCPGAHPWLRGLAAQPEPSSPLGLSSAQEAAVGDPSPAWGGEMPGSLSHAFACCLEHQFISLSGQLSHVGTKLLDSSGERATGSVGGKGYLLLKLTTFFFFPFKPNRTQSIVCVCVDGCLWQYHDAISPTVDVSLF